MRSLDPGHRQFHYDTPCLGWITKVYGVGRNADVGQFFPPNRLYVDVRPFDNRGYCFKALVLTAPGFTANCRVGMMVSLHFINGNPQNAVVTMHHYNADPTTYNGSAGTGSSDPSSPYADPLPSMFVNLDDVLMHHHGSSAFLRAGGLSSSPAAWQPDGGPGIIALGLASAFTPTGDTPFGAAPILTLQDYPPPVTAPPTKPTQAKVSITMPNGASFVLDEPTAGTSTLLYTHPTGATLACNALGTWTMTSVPAPGEVQGTVAGPMAAPGEVQGTVAGPMAAPGSPLGNYTMAVSAIEQQVKTTTGGGFYTLYDDVGRAISHVSPSGLTTRMSDALQSIEHLTPGGLTTELSDVKNAITHATKGGLTTLITDATNEISHLVPAGGQIGLGKLVADMDPTNNAVNIDHLTEFKTNMMSQMLQSFSTVFSTAMATANIPNAGAFAAIVGASGWVTKYITPPTMPKGSNVVSIDSGSDLAGGA